MSRVRANQFTDKAGTGSPTFTKGAIVTGVVTATSFSGSGANLTGIDATALKDSGGNVKVQANPTGAFVTGVLTATSFVGNITGNASGTAGGLSGTPNITVGSVTATTGTFSSNVSVGGTLTYEDVTNIDAVGLITARSGVKVTGGDLTVGTAATVYSDGNAIVGILTATQFKGDGSGLSGVISGIEAKSSGSSVGTGITVVNWSGATVVGDSIAGIATVTIAAAGLEKETITVTNGNTATLDLSKQDHKVTASGTVTITCAGGSEGDSHDIRIVNNGAATIGFSTYFLWPSGSPPTLPTLTGKISLISFTINRVGAAGTQLLSGASVNYS